jgi:hypothetical protein
MNCLSIAVFHKPKETIIIDSISVFILLILQQFSYQSVLQSQENARFLQLEFCGSAVLFCYDFAFYYLRLTNCISDIGTLFQDTSNFLNFYVHKVTEVWRMGIIQNSSGLNNCVAKFRETNPLMDLTEWKIINFIELQQLPERTSLPALPALQNNEEFQVLWTHFMFDLIKMGKRYTEDAIVLL